MSERKKMQNRKEKLERLIKLQRTASSPTPGDIPDQMKQFQTDDSLDFDIFSESHQQHPEAARFNQIKIVSPSNKLESTKDKKLKEEIKDCVIFQNKGIQQKCSQDGKVDTHINSQFLSNFMRKREN